MKTVFNRVLDLLFPPRCIFCADIMLQKKETMICDTCLLGLKAANKAVCPICKKVRPCKCLPYIKEVCSVFEYNDTARKGIWGYKFRGRKAAGKGYAGLIANRVKAVYVGIDFDYVMCVPMTFKGIYKRGYNQSELLAKNVSKLLSIKDGAKFLLKVKETQKQSRTKNKTQRRKNVEGVFTIQKKFEKTLENKSILLIDDVVTTGSTLKECAKVLKRAGCRQVYCAVLCSSPR